MYILHDKGPYEGEVVANKVMWRRVGSERRGEEASDRLIIHPIHPIRPSITSTNELLLN